ncbi:flagellar hook-basal body complex protein FliE [Heyndrickxia ginsengihumi]|uniref:flagellar hook-basal body complex protein FliE n=1 Tax=Heyndrickxia ginsengihumi TaxID=363870 RepID=UPI0004728812|nr:flagellar hook-basal body complex protein FliE [Heyndrickxia ginsengihumi]MBE6183865.1 flagellar hook-basal body complex protein FliE [Bacillus sp. (in: firmicutes)]
MAIQNITSNLISGNLQNTTSSNSSKGTSNTFSNILKKSIDTVNQQQNTSDQMINKLATGGDVDLYQVLIATQKANITMQTALEIRNKAVEGYQEMMRMQV